MRHGSCVHHLQSLSVLSWGSMDDIINSKSKNIILVLFFFYIEISIQDLRSKQRLTLLMAWFYWTFPDTWLGHSTAKFVLCYFRLQNVHFALFYLKYLISSFETRNETKFWISRNPLSVRGEEELSLWMKFIEFKRHSFEGLRNFVSCFRVIWKINASPAERALKRNNINCEAKYF